MNDSSKVMLLSLEFSELIHYMVFHIFGYIQTLPFAFKSLYTICATQTHHLNSFIELEN